GEGFCRGGRGLRVRGREGGRHVLFGVGERGVLLVFNPDAPLKGDVLPARGARGPSHFALGVRAGTLPDWRRRLAEHGVAIEKEVGWPRGGYSLYFRDPAGDLGELVTPRILGLPSGW